MCCSVLFSHRAVLDITAGLLSLDPFRLGDALTQKYMVLRGEEITTPLTVQQVSCKEHALHVLTSVRKWKYSSCSAQPGQHEACMCKCCPGCALQLEVRKQKT